MFDLVNDTIVAVSSAAGIAARGIVRCSGPEALSLAARVFTSQSGQCLTAIPGFRRVRGTLTLEEGCAVPAVLYLFRAPRSYTRQDSAEFHVPGSPPVLAMLLDRFIALGARQAEPGEFTARALLAGAMDLTQVEAVAHLIHARSDTQLRAARRMLDGAFADRIASAVDGVAELVALVEADIDFAEESIEFISPGQLVNRLNDLARDLQDLLAHTESAERLNILPHILLIGRSNAGKSTLMNRLTGLDRSICSPHAGTTRDLLSAPLRLGAGEAILLDAAGVDPDMERLMAQAGAATRSAAARVDLLVLVVDLADEPDDAVFELADLAPGTPCALLGNKIDLLGPDARAARKRWLEDSHCGPVCLLSAVTGEGVEACHRMLADRLQLPDAQLGHDTLVLNARQRRALASALESISRCLAQAQDLGQTIDRADILAFELREALESLGCITGSVTTDDLLARIFSSFCIGK